MLKRLSVLGMIGPLVYVFHVILGGVLWEGYNHIHQPISDLTASGSPDRTLLQNILYVYYFCVFVFSIAAYIYFKDYKYKSLKAAMIMLILIQVCSVAYGFFPEDLIGEETTFTGIMHYVVTGAIVPLTILCPMMAGIAFKKIDNFKKYSLYSIITTVIIFVAGGTSVMLAAQKIDYFGLVERINIGSYQLWLFVIALKLFRTNNITTNAEKSIAK